MNAQMDVRTVYEVANWIGGTDRTVFGQVCLHVTDKPMDLSKKGEWITHLSFPRHIRWSSRILVRGDTCWRPQVVLEKG